MIMQNKIIRTARTLALLAATTPSLALAHVVMTPATAAPGGGYLGAFSVSHGCNGAATVALRVELPPGATGVKPQAKPGWIITIEREPLAAPIPGEGGRMITTRVRAITWKGLLPDDQFDTFGVMLRAPKTAGPLYIPAVQTCEKGENRWVDIPAPGQAWHSVPHPAPVITLVAAATAPLAKGIVVSGGWTRTPPPGAPTAAGYVTITNGGPEPDKLLGGESDIAAQVQVHQMSVVNDRMVMRPVEGGLDIPVGSTVKLAPSGYHIMLIGPKAFPKPGEHATLTLNFVHAGKVSVDLQAYAQGESPPDAADSGEHDHMGAH